MNDPENTYILKHPFRFGREEVAELHFRRAKIGDLKRLPQNDEIASGIHIMGKLTGQPPSIIEEMDAEDFAGAGEVMANFLPKSPETGKTSSESSPIE